jgi:hypothetical protein
MEEKSHNTTLNTHYIQISDRNPYEDHQETTLKKNTFARKFNCYSKYALIFSGIIILILMVVFGINNVATSFGSVDAENNTLSSTVEADVENETLSSAEADVENETEMTPRQLFDMLKDEEDYGSASSIMTVISNKTVIIDGPNNSVVITN